jgi:hypothetical protein
LRSNGSGARRLPRPVTAEIPSSPVNALSGTKYRSITNIHFFLSAPCDNSTADMTISDILCSKIFEHA